MSKRLALPFSIAVFIGLLSLFPLSCVVAQTTQSLGINQLLYATIPNFAIEGSPMVTLSDGVLNATSNNAPQYYINLDTDSSSYATGDFFSTGVLDIAAIITFSGGGSGSFYYFVVFANNNGVPQYLTATELGDRIIVNKISYNNGVFSADIITQGPNDGMCCPTLHEVLQYQLQNGSLVETTTNNSPNTSLANSYNNPGLLKDSSGNLISYSSPQDGYAALLNYLQAMINGTSPTGIGPIANLADFSNIYAPLSGNNNPAQYAADLANQLGVSPAATLGSLQPRIGEFATAIANNNGYTSKNETNQPTSPQTPISPLPISSSSTDTNQLLILFVIVILVIFALLITGIVWAMRSRPQIGLSRKSTNGATAIYLIIIGIACWVSENPIFIILGCLMMYLALILYIKGKAKVAANTAKQNQRSNPTGRSNPSSENKAQVRAKERLRHDDPEMKKLYRKLMHKYHPDRAQSEEDKKFRNDLTVKINKAYQEGDIETLRLFE